MPKTKTNKARNSDRAKSVKSATTGGEGKVTAAFATFVLNRR
jgi:hypothetical protein